MKQYNSIKAKYPDAMLLFRVGDFYETFGEDAIKAANILGIVLTRRANGAASYIELAGFPHHSIDIYLPKLVRAGQRVAICDQLEDPKLTKKLLNGELPNLLLREFRIMIKFLSKKRIIFWQVFIYMEIIQVFHFLIFRPESFLLQRVRWNMLISLFKALNPAKLLFRKIKKRGFLKYSEINILFPLSKIGFLQRSFLTIYC